MIDNFELIEGLIQKQSIDLKWLTDNPRDAFYHLQIIQRKKDIEGLGCNNVMIRSTMVDLDHPLNKLKPQIIEACEFYKARAYINVNPKSKEEVAIQMLTSLADCFRKRDFNYTKRLWNSAAVTVTSIAGMKSWVIDLDYSENFTETDTGKVVGIINKSMPLHEKILATVPTLHGVHLIVQPFDSRHLILEYPAIDIHKNNPTILYVPNSLT